MSAETGVFVLNEEGTLVAMQAASFASEDDFQRLLASFPALLAGDQIDPETPRRFVLVAREQAIAGEQGGAGRWSLDHLFLDQDGVPTLVEVKRGTDTRVRREVVGQMLDYAANAVLHWPADELRARFVARCAAEGDEPDAALGRLLGSEGDPDAFWEQVQANLAVGRIRLLFVADRIPPELRRVVEFLNRQMRPAEVLAIELRQYEGQGLKTLVPIVLGQTEDVRDSKGIAVPKRVWAEASLLADLESRAGPEMVTVARAMIDWAKLKSDRLAYNTNPRWGSMTPEFAVGDAVLPAPFRLWSDGTFAVNFEYMVGRPVFGDPGRREELRQRLNEVGGINLGADAISKRPTVPLAALAIDGRVGRFLGVMDWFVAELRGDAASPD